MFQTIRRFFKQTATARAIVAFRNGLPEWTPRDYAELAREGYQKNVIGFKCVDYIANACAGLEWIQYRQQSKRRIEMENSPLLQLLHKPNPLQTQNDLLYSMIAYQMLAGNTYIERVGPGINGLGTPRELYSLRPDRMKVIPDDGKNIIKGYEYNANGHIIPLLRDRITHWKRFHPTNDLYGMSPIEAAAYSIDQNNLARAWNISLYRNSARPPLIITADGDLDDAQFERLEAALADRYSGHENPGKPFFAGGGIKIEKLSLDPADMEWVEGLKLSSREICTAFGVAPELLGDAANKTYSNYKEARTAFYEETILPLADSLREILNVNISVLFGDRIRLDYNRDAIEALREDQDKVYIRLEKCTFLTINEKREACGYEAYADPEADKIHINAQLIPLDSMSTMELQAQADLDASPGSTASSGDNTPTEDGKKGLNLSTYEAKRAYWLTIEQHRTVFYSAATRQIAQQFRADLRRLDSMSPQEYLFSLGETQPAWIETLSTVFERTARVFASRAFVALNEDDEKLTVLLETKAGEDLWLKFILDYARKTMASKVSYITDTTREAIRDTLAKGIVAGEGVHELAARIKRLYLDEIIPRRAEVIARTEVVAASNAGAHAAAKATQQITGSKYEHEWVATPDRRTREHHHDASGQRRDIDEPFIVDGEQLMFPGDSSLGASANNVVQCRCTEVFHVRKKAMLAAPDTPAPLPPPPQVNVTTAPVSVTTPPVNVHLELPGGKKKIQTVLRDESGRIASVETREEE